MLPNPPEVPPGRDQNPTSSDRRELATTGVPADREGSFLLGDRAFQALFEAAMDAMVIVDTAGCHVAVNQAACQLFGLGRAELLHCCMRDFTPPNFDLGPACQAFQEQGQQRGEMPIQLADGTLRVVEYAATANFVPHYHLVVLRDVTERKQLEQQLQQLNQDLEQQVVQRTAELQQANSALQGVNQQLQASQQKYQTLFEILPIGVSITDSEGQFMEANLASEQILGVSVAEHLRRTCEDSRWQMLRPDGSLMPSEEFPSVRALQENRPIVGIEQGVRWADGTIHWITTSVSPIPLEPYGVAIAYIDITERKQAELALRESEARLAATFASSPDAILISRLRDAMILDVNPQFLEMSGYRRDEVIGQTSLVLRLWNDPDERAKILAQLQVNPILQNYEITFRRKSGEVFAALVSCRVIDLGGDACVLVVVRDISDRKAAEMALRQSEATNRAILATLPDLLLQMDDTGRYLRLYRREGIRLFRPAQVWEGTLVFDLLPAPMATERMHYVHQALDTNSLQVYEYALEFEDETRYEEARIVPMEDGTVLVLVRDITDRKVAELHLSQREREFRTLAENSPDAILRCDRHYRFLYVNPTVAHLTGTAAESYLGKTSADLGLPPHLVELWQEAMERVFVTAQEQAIEYDMELLPGKLTFYSRIVPEFQADGEVASVLVVIRDITALKQAQEALAQQSERERSLRLIAQHIRETLDLEDILTTAVKEVQRILQADRVLILRLGVQDTGVVIQEVVQPGYPVLLGTCWADEYLSVSCAERYGQGVVRIISGAELLPWEDCLIPFQQQTAVKSKVVAPITQTGADGSRHVWGLLIVHACGEERRWHPEEADLLQQVTDQLAIAIHQAELYNQVQQLNITLEQQVQERTAALQQTLEFEQLLQRITEQVCNSLDEAQILETVVRELGQGLQIECCDTGIYSEDLTTSTITHEFTRSLPSAKGSTFLISEAIHRDIYPFLFQGQILQFCDRISCSLRPDQRHLTVLACAISDDQRVLGDLWLYKQASFNESEVRLVQQVANQCAIALRQSRLYQAAQFQVQELERLNHLKDDFLSTVSHELRTPIANIKMATQMLEISLNRLGWLQNPSATSILRYFNILQEECQREMNLINDLLDLTRLDQEQEPLNLTAIALSDTLPRLVEGFVERACEQQQQLILQIPEHLPPITTHWPYLERILTELLQNACKYTPVGETITLSVQATPTLLEIALSNSGVAIPPTEYSRIFDKFYRIPNHDPWKYGGTGLGLALVKTMLKPLNGTLIVTSQTQPSLTTFTLRLPYTLSAPSVTII